MLRETSKVVEITGRRFEVRKFDALTGSYVAYTLLTKMLPAFMSNGVEGLEDVNKLNAKDLPPMSFQEFKELQVTCLKQISEVTDVGGLPVKTAVILPDGRWGIPDLEFDGGFVMLLTGNVIGYNVESFLSESVLNEIKTLIPTA